MVRAVRSCILSRKGVKMVTETLGHVQTVTLFILAALLFTIVMVGLALRQSVEYGIMHPRAALRTIDWTSNVVGLVFGPVVIIVAVSIFSPQFARWMVNVFLLEAASYQLDLQRWLDKQIVDDLSATGAGAILRTAQLGFAMLCGLIGLAFRGFLKLVMGRAYQQKKLAERIRSVFS